MYLGTLFMMADITHLNHKEIKTIIDFIIKEKPEQESCDLQEQYKNVFNEIKKIENKSYKIKDLKVKGNTREDNKDGYTYLIGKYELSEKYIKLFEKLGIEEIQLYKLNSNYVVGTDYIIAIVRKHF